MYVGVAGAVDLSDAVEFTGERTLKRAAAGERMLEFACHEGNYSMTGILAGARKQEPNP